MTTWSRTPRSLRTRRRTRSASSILRVGAILAPPPAWCTDRRKTRALSGEENKRDPEDLREPESSERIEEAQGSPEEPASPTQPGEDPGTVGDTEEEEEPAAVEEELAILAEELRRCAGSETSTWKRCAA